MIFPRSFPFEYQLDSMDCGPACLKIIAKYFGKYHSLQYLRDLCGITREGVSFLDLSYGAEKIGLHTLAVKLDIQTLHEKVPLPCIVHWNNSHFIVVYKTTRQKVFVSDPAKGLLSYTYDEFKQGWYKEGEETGALLAIEPMADFLQRDLEERTERAKTFQNVLGYFLPYRKNFVTLFFIMLIATALQGLLPFISKAVIDVGIQTHDLNFINLVLIANIVIIVSVTISGVIRDWLLLHITARVNIALISDYLIKLMQLPVTFFENKMIGDILQRAQDHERIRSFIMNNSINLIFSTLTFLAFSIILLVYNAIIFVIFLGGSILYVGWVLGFLKIRKKLDWEYFTLISQNQSYWVETVSAIHDIKINNYEKQKRWKWEDIQAKLYKVNLRVLNITNAQNMGAQFIESIKNLLITFYCAKAVIGGEITFGVMISTQFIIGMLNSPLNQFIGFIISAQYAKISFLRINEIHQLRDEEDTVVTNSLNIPDNKSLILKNVSFQYTPNVPFVLKQINLIIPEGKITAFVGGSGSGKSTLLKLVLRLYNPSFGEILIGNMNISNLSLREWRDHCGVVMQEGKIFNDTILNNITLDDEKIDYERLKEAVRISNIASEIEQMPKGYQTKIGEVGRGLSGGQKQRMLIARALYKNPSFLFLDEATNALDAINEHKIVQALNHAFDKRTVVVVAHRLSTIMNADQIVVLKDGIIIEVGNHEKLMEKHGHYYDLVDKQIGVWSTNGVTKSELVPVTDLN
ncbi:peptidase domain-containing ABC transporter [Mangrovibacterium marinum]|uniref:peptidase domain-containing ABC transporter n=1 Tax=Mangrovibacterium marinum TaxID=1639118 RepID=UPI002A18B790|nr:peptidase domain-containing ABC transporter [Mangrovibacterium marinum]